MRCECPTLRRCCLCLPLRYGLVGAGCTKLVLDICFLIYFCTELQHINRNTPVMVKIMLIAFVVLLSVDLIFNHLLLYGCYKKNSVILRIFYRYCLFLLVVNILWVLTIIIGDIVIAFLSVFVWIFTIYSVAISVMVCIIGIILNLYLTILVRSEVVKLEDNTQFQFTNNADGTCAVTATNGDVEQAFAMDVESVRKY